MSCFDRDRIDHVIRKPLLPSPLLRYFSVPPNDRALFERSAMSRLRLCLSSVSLFLATLIASPPFVPTALAQANVQGQWQTLPYTMPINPIHVALLRTGKVLVV